MQPLDVEANRSSKLFSVHEQHSPLASTSTQNPTSHTECLTVETSKNLCTISKIERLQQTSRSLGNHKFNCSSDSSGNNSTNNNHEPSAWRNTQNDKEPISYWNYKQTGVKSRPIKVLKHPIEHIERKIILTYLLGFLFKLIAIISGPLIVLVVVFITLPFIVIRRLIWFLLNLRCISDARISTQNHPSAQLDIDNNLLDWRYCPLTYLEAYWFKEKLINTIILVVDQQNTEEFSIESLRCIMRQNILSKPVFKKFLSSVVAKGIPYYKSYYWKYLGSHNDTADISRTKSTSMTENRKVSTTSERIRIDSSTESDVSSSNSTTSLTTESQVDFHIQMPPDLNQPNDDSFCIERHIYLDDCLKDTNKSLVSIRNYAHRLLELKLNDVNCPLWELRAIPTSKKRTYLIFRCHQSLADGRSLTEILTKHLTNLPSSPYEIGSHLHSNDAEISSENNLEIIKEKESFISKFGKFSGLRSAILIGPLTVLLWIIWSFTRRKNNHLNSYPTDKFKDLKVSHRKRFHITKYDLTKFFQIKQMTRSTVSDILLCALSGSLREYLRKFNGVSNPPNLNISLTVDMNGSKSEKCTRVPQVNCTLLNVPLPTSVEGAVPRLWELRNTMEELRTSADPWVMVGLQQFLYNVMPLNWYQWFINRIALRNSSVIVSNMRGPQNMVESWCVDLFQRALQESQQPPQVVQQDQLICYKGEEAIRNADNIVQKIHSRTKRKNCLLLNESTTSVSGIYYCLQPPTSDIPISFNCITYQNKLFITILSRSLLVENSKLLSQLFFKQLNQLALTIAKRKSLVTIVRSHLPIEINYSPVSPVKLDDREESEDNNLNSNSFNDTCRSDRDSNKIDTLTPLECSEDETEVNSSKEYTGEICKTCSKSKCTCKRRQSLVNLDLKSRSSLYSSLNPLHLMVPQSDRTDESNKIENSEFEECMCGQQLLHDLDEEKSSDESDNKLNKEVASTSSGINNEYPAKHNTSNSKLCCKKCQVVTKQSTTSLNESQRKGQTWTNQAGVGSRVSAQLVVPNRKSTFLPKAHSKSETDLLPTMRIESSTCSSCTRDSRFSLKKFLIFTRANSQNQQTLRTRASLANIQYDGGIRNLIELPAELFHKRYIEKSKRRQSIATSHGISQVNRTIIVKDEINADVNLRYQLDGPLTIIHKRRSSMVGNERRRASLIPFGFMHNQSFPKLFSEEREAHL